MAVDEYPIDTVKVCLHRNFSVYVRITILWKSIVDLNRISLPP